MNLVKIFFNIAIGITYSIIMNTRKKMVSSATDKQKCSENHLIIVIIIDFFSLFINEPPFQYTLKERRSFVFIWKKKNFVYLFTPRHLKNKN